MKQMVTSQCGALESHGLVMSSKVGSWREWFPRHGNGRILPSLPGAGPVWWKVGAEK